MIKYFAFVTDTHLNQQLTLSGINSDKMDYQYTQGKHLNQLEEILADLKKKKITDIIFGGDIGSQNSNKIFFEIIRKNKFNLRMILGNHDKFDEVKKYYQTEELSGTLDYTFEEEYFKCICLDSSANIITEKQITWLSQEIRTTKKIIIFIHHPVLAIPSLIDKTGAALKERDLIEKILSSVPNDIYIFCGHYHMNNYVRQQNIHQYCTIASSYEIIPDPETLSFNQNTFGYRVIKLGNNTLDTQTIICNNKSENK